MKMKHLKLSIAFITLISFSSCYLYDGPVRPKRTLLPPPDKVYIPTSKSEYMAKAGSEMKEKLIEADVTMLNDSISVLFPNHIIYSLSALAPITDIEVQMNQLASLLTKYSATDILVTGHTDNIGEIVLNKKISQIRADIIKDMLLVRNINAERLSSWGLGPQAPIASNEIEEGRAKNRRVEFVVLYSAM